MIVADIGNSRIHIMDERGDIYHLDYKTAIERFGDEEVYYISVKHEISESLKSLKKWTDVSAGLVMDGFYEGMGADRKAISLSMGDGIYIDAGSAVTIDIVREGRYLGGTILPGIKKLKECYSSISPALSVEPEFTITQFPLNTSAQIGYGIIAPIYSLILNIRNNDTVWISGGDGRLISRFIEDAVYDERLVFKGILNSISSQTAQKMKDC